MLQLVVNKYKNMKQQRYAIAALEETIHMARFKVDRLQAHCPKITFIVLLTTRPASHGC